MSKVPTVETDVLIAGAGPAGAAAGALLATYGVRAMVLNKYGSVANTPRAHITNQRTMEVLRDLGLEDEAKRSATPQHLMGEHVWATSLTGPELGRLRTWYTHPSFQAEHDLASPTAVCDLPQDRMEPILLGAATHRGTTLRVNTELLSFTQDDDGVTATVLDRLTGEEYRVRAKYLIGADGGKSAIMSQLGIPMEGEMGLGGSINVVFEADLEHLVAHRPGDMYWFIQPGVGHDGNGIGVLRVVRPWNKWIAVWGYDIAQGTPELTDEFGASIVHQLLGDDTVPVRVESVSTWSVNHVYATDNQAGRVFCVGDAVHRHSPMNGLGSNTSIQDSFNLCWKLAMVLRGRAGPGLLETYRDERLPVARQIVERATRSNALMPPLFGALRLPPAAGRDQLEAALETLRAPTAEGAERRAAFDEAMGNTLLCFNTHGVETNQDYRTGALVTGGEPAPQAPRDEELHYFPTTYPGRHLPHAWLLDGQRKVPVLDLCGRGRFTLLTGVRGAAWREAAEKAAAATGVEVHVVSIGRGCDYEDRYGDWAGVSGIGEDGALLVRPDHIVGWRATAQGDDPGAALLEVLRSVLRTPAA
ncbi:FAD-dependent monooxygenase [Streptomyces sp. SID8352]|uniref:FAD-dependent monooxygenase n=1 Tax=Streptomyces sp. SID8352 TaxID=2690338 RepID=UPI001369BA27|nr:FAD-dependent monooxygenase [Streptomyces sp. SID8352]MYU25093.1 2,4-dichlorophenol 6-monooxygenase [Streptomyces sp. SID8352]